MARPISPRQSTEFSLRLPISALPCLALWSQRPEAEKAGFQKEDTFSSKGGIFRFYVSFCGCGLNWCRDPQDSEEKGRAGCCMELWRNTVPDAKKCWRLVDLGHLKLSLPVAKVANVAHVGCSLLFAVEKGCDVLHSSRQGAGHSVSHLAISRLLGGRYGGLPASNTKAITRLKRIQSISFLKS